MSKNIVVVEARANSLSAVRKFWLFNQNNPGGSFIIDDDHAEDMWFEATSPDDANRRAEFYGLNLDGDECPGCCGSRWSSQTSYYDTSKEVPSVWISTDDGRDGYDLSLAKAQLWLESQSGEFPRWAPGSWTPVGKPWAIVVYLDGRVEKYLKPDISKVTVTTEVGEPIKNDPWDRIQISSVPDGYNDYF